MCVHVKLLAMWLVTLCSTPFQWCRYDADDAISYAVGGDTETIYIDADGTPYLNYSSDISRYDEARQYWELVAMPNSLW